MYKLTLCHFCASHQTGIAASIAFTAPPGVVSLSQGKVVLCYNEQVYLHEKLHLLICVQRALHRFAFRG